MSMGMGDAEKKTEGTMLAEVGFAPPPPNPGVYPLPNGVGNGILNGVVLEVEATAETGIAGVNA